MLAKRFADEVESGGCQELTDGVSSEVLLMREALTRLKVTELKKILGYDHHHCYDLNLFHSQILLDT